MGRFSASKTAPRSSRNTQLSPSSVIASDRHAPARFELTLDRLVKGSLPHRDGLRPFGLAFELVVEDRLFQRHIQMLPEFSHAPLAPGWDTFAQILSGTDHRGVVATLPRRLHSCFGQRRLAEPISSPEPRATRVSTGTISRRRKTFSIHRRRRRARAGFGSTSMPKHNALKVMTLTATGSGGRWPVAATGARPTNRSLRVHRR